MRSTQDLLQLKEQAIALRRAGKSRRQIKEILGIVSNATLDRALRGEPPPDWTRRPRAKDAVRARARDLREKGLDYEEIAAVLGVSKGSISLWVRDMPTPPHLTYEESRKRSAEGARRYWAAERPVREAAREAVVTAAAAQIGPLSDREILVAGAIAYWCEGAKGRPRKGLDVSIRSQILNLMNGLQESHGLTYVVISHDLSVVKYLSDRIGVMYLGKLVELGPSQAIYTKPAHPYTLGLINAIPEPDPRRERAKDVSPIRGELPSALNPPVGCRFNTRCPRVQDVCREVEPPLRPFGPQHLAACHFPLQQPTAGGSSAGAVD